MVRPPRRTPPTARLSDAELAPLDGVSSWPGTHVEVYGQRIFVRSTPAETEAAEPALLVHGLSGASINWTDFAGLLRVGVRAGFPAPLAMPSRETGMVSAPQTDLRAHPGG